MPPTSFFRRVILRAAPQRIGFDLEQATESTALLAAAADGQEDEDKREKVGWGNECVIEGVRGCERELEERGDAEEYGRCATCLRGRKEPPTYGSSELFPLSHLYNLA